MFFDDDLPKKKTAAREALNLETLSVAELQEYISWLEGEIARARGDIEKKKAAAKAADGFFKS